MDGAAQALAHGTAVAWLRSRPEPTRQRAVAGLGCRPTASAIRTNLALVVVVAVLAATFEGLLGPFDLLTFLHAGQRVVAGLSPYPALNSAAFLSGHAFVYPVFVAWLFTPLSALPTQVATDLYLAVSVIAIAAACRLLGRRGPSAPVLVLVMSTTIVGLQMGTLNAGLLCGVALAWFWRDRHPVLGGAVLGVVAAAKLFLLPVLAWPIITRRYHSAAGSVGAAGLLLIAGAWFGPLSPLGYIRLLTSLQGREQVSSWSLSSLVESLGVPWSRTGELAAAVVVGLLIAAWSRRAKLSDAQVLGFTVACGLLLSPILWSSYLLLVTVPLLLSTSGSLPLAAAALASWVVVTPDAASPARVAVGVVATLAVAVLSTHRELGALPARLARYRARGRSLIWIALVPVGATIVVAVLPEPVRSPALAVAVILLMAGLSWSHHRQPPPPSWTPTTPAR